MGVCGSKPGREQKDNQATKVTQPPKTPSQRRNSSGSVAKQAAESSNAEKYEEVRNVGSGAFGVCKLMKNTQTGELVAVKQMERGEKIDINVQREVLNHKQLVHSNIVQFKEVFVTDTHLCVALEYAAGGELFDTVAKAGKLGEIEARYFFQQLILGIEYCHNQGVVHRDLKLENLLLDGSPSQRLKIADFGYSKNMYASQPKSTVGTVAYIAPEVLTSKRDSTKYKGPAADLWSAGVILYVMLSGTYPFEDAKDPRNMKKTVEAILDVKYTMPKGLSRDCREILKGIFQPDPAARLSVAQIKKHPWFTANLPAELSDQGLATALSAMEPSPQTDEDIRSVLKQAQVRRPSQKEIEFFAKHGYTMGEDGSTQSRQQKERTPQEYSSGFIDAELDQIEKDYMNGVEKQYSVDSEEHNGALPSRR